MGLSDVFSRLISNKAGNNASSKNKSNQSRPAKAAPVQGKVKQQQQQQHGKSQKRNGKKGEQGVEKGGRGKGGRGNICLIDLYEVCTILSYCCVHCVEAQKPANAQDLDRDMDECNSFCLLVYSYIHHLILNFECVFIDWIKGGKEVNVLAALDKEMDDYRSAAKKEDASVPATTAPTV